MNPIQDIIRNLQDLMAQVPEILQPVIVMLAGAIPFVEGEGAAVIGIVAGMNPVVAGIAAAVGNFVCVALVVLLTSGARSAVVSRSRDLVSVDTSANGVPGSSSAEQTMATSPTAAAKPESKGRLRFKAWVIRFGVPGASILGPLAIPTQFTSAILVASGVPRGWVLLWQAVAIAIWTTVATVSAWAAMTLVIGA